MDLRRYAATLAVFATGLYVAMLIAALGVLSVVLARDPIDDKDAGIFAGPIACALAAAVVITGLLVRALKRNVRRREVAIGTAVLLGVGAYVGYAVGGGIVVGVADPYRFLPFVVEQLIGPFSAAAGILALIVVLLDMIVLSARMDERGRPRWPWEKSER
jgi:MFS family permease